MNQVLGLSFHIDDRFATNPGRIVHRDQLIPLLARDILACRERDLSDALEDKGKTV
ncbi:hypothetical protein [Sphingopyxis panaciterrulae]|uniref:Uncharacterized protein n=1 Tax=Sphingopyxis panaciterrulae TaxID=462372 RepID=A0A7W9ERK4_9SPHN|nr:hypothetical protein [Sphingopyxis panaciterrulae]MBB5707669.1 hypothetical protein [Sphingopyxis panaciterrulae]